MKRGFQFKEWIAIHEDILAQLIAFLNKEFEESTQWNK